MVKKRVFAIVISIALMLIFIPSQVSAGPYMGGYLKHSVVTSNKVLVAVNYQMTQASQIPSSKSLMGVASVAGANGLAPSGWVYQNGVGLRHSNDVYFGTSSLSLYLSDERCYN